MSVPTTIPSTSFMPETKAEIMQIWQEGWGISWVCIQHEQGMYIHAKEGIKFLLHVHHWNKFGNTGLKKCDSRSMHSNPHLICKMEFTYHRFSKKKFPYWLGLCSGNTL
jgi:hypothetical protein